MNEMWNKVFFAVRFVFVSIFYEKEGYNNNNKLDPPLYM